MEKNEIKLNKIINHFSRNLFTYIPLAAFIGSFILFGILSGGISWSPINLRTLINSGIIIATVATASIFIYSLGMLDISLGSTIGLATIIGAYVYLQTNNILITFVVIILLTVIISVLNAIIITYLNLPSFVVTLVMMNVLSALNSVIVTKITDGGNMISVATPLLRTLDNIWVKLIGFAIVMLSSVFIFNYTKLGRQNKIQGANVVNAIQSGVNVKKNVIISFAILGFGMGIAAFLLLTYVRAGAASNGNSYGFDVILALVLGGMLVSGGPRSNIFAGAIGAFTITNINIGMLAMGVDSSIIQIVRGIIFLIILVVLNWRYRSNYLN